MTERKSHHVNTDKTGPTSPTTWCGRLLIAVDLAPFHDAPTCKQCRKGMTSGS